jgi:hypothetical protein
MKVRILSHVNGPSAKVEKAETQHLISGKRMSGFAVAFAGGLRCGTGQKFRLFV